MAYMPKISFFYFIILIQDIKSTDALEVKCQLSWFSLWLYGLHSEIQTTLLLCFELFQAEFFNGSKKLSRAPAQQYSVDNYFLERWNLGKPMNIRHFEKCWILFWDKTNSPWKFIQNLLTCLVLNTCQQKTGSMQDGQHFQSLLGDT